MKKGLLFSLLVFIIMLIFTGCSNPAGVETEIGPTQDIFYVCPGGSGEKNGSSWEDAYENVQDAIDAAALLAKSTDKKYVLILEGTYYPSSWPNMSESVIISAVEGSADRDRLMHFSLRNNVTVIGGFRGNESDIVPQGNVTVLSGDIGTEGEKDDNTYHVFYHPYGTNLDASAILKSVTITGGNAGDNYQTPIVCIFGGGMFNNTSSPFIENCIFSDNKATGSNGGGMANLNSKLIIKNCTFSDNSAVSGGGIHNSEGSPMVVNCTFNRNTAYSFFGGGMFIDYSNSTVVNCTFTGNSALTLAGSGGGIYNTGNIPTVVNCTFTGNTASFHGGGIYNVTNGDPLKVYGSILVGNSAPAASQYNHFTGSDNLIQIENFSGGIGDVFTDVEDGKALLRDNNSLTDTQTLMIKNTAHTQLSVSAVTSWGLSAEALAILAKDQRGYSRGEVTTFKGAVDPLGAAP